ncbi:unnamed protein product [Rhizoctonia solani]|uniref:Uncharacterized protein n=1 Tax=Rhizoctonia solani TaxID=456999 RepID=A0A8H3BJ57_9AGAM|nr:unnamed protein product [Rhizoctonia solani]
MPVNNPVVPQSMFHSQRIADTAACNLTLFDPGEILPILPMLNICNTIPDSSTSVHDPHTNTYHRQDDWVFDSLIMYAHPESDLHPDYSLDRWHNRWSLRIWEHNHRTNQYRIIVIEPTFNPQGQLFGFTMCLEAEEYEARVSKWAVTSYKIRATPYTPPNDHHSRSLYHYEWIVFLNDRVCQEDYMRIMRIDRTGFFLNMVRLFVRIGAANSSDIEELTSMTERTFWINANTIRPSVRPTTVTPSAIFNWR